PGKRYIAPREAGRIIAALRAESLDWSAVGVFVDPTLAEVVHAAEVCGLDYVQLSGHEPRELVERMPRPTLKALHVRTGGEAAAVEAVASNSLRAHRYLLDTHTDLLPGGTGRSFELCALTSVGLK